MRVRLPVVLCLMIAAVLLCGSVSLQAYAQTTMPAATRPADVVKKVLDTQTDDAGKPVARVKRVKEAPKIDGQIEKEWGEPDAKGFFDEMTGRRVGEAVQTQVWLAYDDKNLYVAARMMEPEMGDLVAATLERDGDVWNDDTFELFLDPGKTKDPARYFQIIINPAGTVADQKGAPDVTGDMAWDCKGCQVKTHKEGKSWSVEMALPLEALGVKEKAAGSRWGANFTRERKPGAAENTTWVNMGPEWHQPEEFGTLVFE